MMKRFCSVATVAVLLLLCAGAYAQTHRQSMIKKVELKSDTNDRLLLDSIGIVAQIAKALPISQRTGLACDSLMSQAAVSALLAEKYSPSNPQRDITGNAATADSAAKAGYAPIAFSASIADSAVKASSADYAATAGSASKATKASSADYAKSAGSASSATKASSADYAKSAGYASSAGSAVTATKMANFGKMIVAHYVRSTDTWAFYGDPDFLTKITTASSAVYGSITIKRETTGYFNIYNQTTGYEFTVSASIRSDSGPLFSSFSYERLIVGFGGAITLNIYDENGVAKDEDEVIFFLTKIK